MKTFGETAHERPIKEGKRPTKPDGLFSGTPAWWETAPQQRPIKRSMKARIETFDRDYGHFAPVTSSEGPLLGFKKSKAEGKSRGKKQREKAEGMMKN